MLREAIVLGALVGLAYLSLHHQLRIIIRRLKTMVVDLSKLTAAEQALVTATETLISIVTKQAANIADLNTQLAAAIAAGGDTTALQTAIDQVTADMVAEAGKAQAALPAAPAAPAAAAPATPAP